MTKVLRVLFGYKEDLTMKLEGSVNEPPLLKGNLPTITYINQ